MNADDKWIVDSATGKILGVQTAGVATSDFVKSSTDPVTGGIKYLTAGAQQYAVAKTAVSDALDTPGTISGLALWLDAADTLYTTTG